MVCLVTPTFLANSSWDKSNITRANFNFIFFKHVPPYATYSNIFFSKCQVYFTNFFIYFTYKKISNKIVSLLTRYYLKIYYRFSVLKSFLLNRQSQIQNSRSFYLTSLFLLQRLFHNKKADGIPHLLSRFILKHFYYYFLPMH